MKKLLLLAAVMMIAVTANAQEDKKEGGSQESNFGFSFFKGEEINGLIADGPINIQLNEDPSNTGVLSNIEDINVTKTTEGYVRLSYGNELTKSIQGKITVKVTVSQLKYLRLTGKCALIAKDKFMRTDEVTISMAGSAASAEYLDIIAKDIKLDIGGTTHLESFNIDTEKLTIKTSGTGPVIVVSGKADSCNIEANAAAKIKMLNCPVKDMEANISGIVSAQVNITGKAYVKVGGTAKFRYVGSGVVEGEGTFKPL